MTRRWAWILVLFAGLGLFWLVLHALVVTANPNLVPSLILLGAAVVPATFVTFVRARRLEFGLSGGQVALIALVGGVLGVVAAGTLEYDTLTHLGVVPMLAVGLIEEAVKLIAPAAVLVWTRHRHPADGLLAGVAAGAGFAALETMGYAFVVLVQSGGSLGVVEQVLLIRGVLSPAAHMAWTGLTAAALWRAVEHDDSGRARGGFIAVFLTAVALHTAWDSLAGPMSYLVLAVLSLGLLKVSAHRLAHDRPVPVRG